MTSLMTETKIAPKKLRFKDDEIEGRTVDEVFDDIDFGTYQWRLLILVGISIASDTMETSLMAFIQSCVLLEWDLSTVYESFLTASVLIGQIIGLLTFGPVADFYGRRTAILIGWTIIVVFGFISCLSVDFWMLAILRAIVGIGIGASQSVAYDLFAETVPTKYRGRLIYISFFQILGVLYVVVAAWILLADYGWRWVAFSCTVPLAITLIIGYFWLLESPRWYASMGNYKDAEHTIKQIAEINEVNVGPIVLKYDPSLDEEQQQCCEYSHLFTAKKNLWWITPSLWTIWFFGYFGYYYIFLVVLLVFATNGQCTYNYLYIFFIDAIEVVGMGATLYNVDYLGRSPTMFIMYLASACFGAAFAEFYNVDWVTPTIVLIFLTKIVISGALPVMWLQTAELYPTSTRATGHATCTIFGRLGAFAAVFWVDDYAYDEILPGAGFFIAGTLLAAILAYNLPETNGLTFEEIYPEDGEEMVTLLHKHKGLELEKELWEGTRVEANFQSRGRWLPGKITRVRRDGTYDIAYDNLASEKGVHEDAVRLEGSGEFLPGSKAVRTRAGNKHSMDQVFGPMDGYVEGTM